VLRLAFLFLAALSCASFAAPSPGGALKSILLVAREELPDPRFRDTVVLVAGGTPAPIGVILNKPTREPLSKALKNAERLKGSDGALFFGGPVAADEAIFVFRSARPPQDAIAVADDVYLSADHDVLEKLLARERPLEGLRIFAGHAGWAPGQLENEIRRGDWYLVPADTDTIFDAKPESLWPALVRKAMATKVRFTESRQ
jgi:putative transcriptional regulator